MRVSWRFGGGARGAKGEGAGGRFFGLATHQLRRPCPPSRGTPDRRARARRECCHPTDALSHRKGPRAARARRAVGGRKRGKEGTIIRFSLRTAVLSPPAAPSTPRPLVRSRRPDIASRPTQPERSRRSASPTPALAWRERGKSRERRGGHSFFGRPPGFSPIARLLSLSPLSPGPPPSKPGSHIRTHRRYITYVERRPSVARALARVEEGADGARPKKKLFERQKRVSKEVCLCVCVIPSLGKERSRQMRLLCKLLFPR